MADLPAIMATLDIKESSNPLRKRTARVLHAQHPSVKRRCSLQPVKKKPCTGDWTSLQSSYESNKLKSKTMNSNLETIYEEPVVKEDGAVSLMGPVKLRRINFNGYITKCKLKKRKSKVKRKAGAKGSGTSAAVKNRKKLSMDAFLARFHSLMATTSNATNTKQEVLAKVLQ